MKPNLKAFLIQLVLSTVVLAGIFAVIYWLWYPDPYFRIKGVSDVVWVLAGINFVLGPVLTYILYKPGKKGLKFDLVVIVLLQVAALFFGVNAIYTERPYFMVFGLDRFNVLAAKDVDLYAITKPEHLDKPWRGALLLVARMPTDPVEYQKLLTETVLEGKPDIERRPEYWVTYREAYPEVLAAAGSVNSLWESRPAAREAIDRMVSKNGRDIAELLFVPVIGRKADYAVVISRQDGAILDALAVNPWP